MQLKSALHVVARSAKQGDGRGGRRRGRTSGQQWLKFEAVQTSKTYKFELYTLLNMAGDEEMRGE
jgi:hypothetical protein